MTDKEKILAFLEGMSKGCCPKETKEIIINKIIPWINDLPKEPVSEDMWEASKQYALRQVLASTDAEMTEQAYLSLKLFSGFEIAVAHKDGANWQKEQDKQWLAEEHKHIFAKGRDSMKQQMMKNAKEGVITFDYYGDNDKIYGCIAHDSFSLEELGLKDGDKVKLLIIKEEQYAEIQGVVYSKDLR